MAATPDDNSPIEKAAMAATPDDHSPIEGKEITRKWNTPVEIDWRSAFDSKQNFLSSITLGLINGAVYPLNVVKYRMQVSSASTNIRTTAILRELNGLQNLYKGCGIMLLTGLPAKVICLGFEGKTKRLMHDLLKEVPIEEGKKKIIAEEGGSMMASLLAQTISVPGDVIRKTMMVEGFNGMPNYKSGLELATKIIKTEGVKGLYKGFSIPFIALSPSNHIWNATYNISQDIFWNYIQKDNISWRKSVVYQAAGGFLAGGMTCCFNHPFDTVATIMQVNHFKKQSTIQVVKELFKEDGFKGFFRGIGPRFVIFSIIGASYTSLYEYFKVGNLVEVPLKNKSFVEVND